MHGANDAGDAASHSGAGGTAPVVSGLPVPPGPSTSRPPSGSSANLKVLPWAGFRSAVTYSFDDSSPSQIDHYKDVNAAGVPVTFYLSTMNAGYPGYDATWKAARAAGHELGNHTVHHCYYDQACNGASAGSAASEIDLASTYLRDHLGVEKARTFAYPFGDVGYATIAKERFFLGRGVSGGTVKPGDATDLFNLPIFAAQGGESAAALGGVVDAAHADGSWVIFLFHSLAPDPESWYAAVDVGNVTASMQHAKSLGDVWVDTVENVGAYFVGQRLLQGAAPSGAGTSLTWNWTLPKNFPPSRYLRVTVDGGTLQQRSTPLPWNEHGYYEVALDAGSLTWTARSP